MKNYKREIIILCLLLLAITAIFYFVDLDITLENRFYNQSDGWFRANDVPWKQIRDYSNLPALLLSVFALVGLILSFNFRRYAPYRKIYLYLVALMLIGPGLIVNLVLKENFGRPRPRSITEFNGKYQYENPLAYDASSPGKSFPCGHASMGFYFFGIYILFRNSRKFLAALGLSLGLVWGGLIGYARMLQGGHFFSDVIWSAALIYLLALWLFHLFRFPPSLTVIPRELSSGKKKIWTAVISIVIVFLILAVLLATPRSRKQGIKIEDFDLAQSAELQIDLQFLKGDLEIIQSDELFIQWEFQGFGFPKSTIRYELEKSRQDSLYIIDFRQYTFGYFTELQQNIVLHIPVQKKIILNYSIANEKYSRRYP